LKAYLRIYQRIASVIYADEESSLRDKEQLFQTCYSYKKRFVSFGNLKRM
jgi:hypothetical protein